MAAPNHNESVVQMFYRIRPLNNEDDLDQWEWIQGEDTINIAGKQFEFDSVVKPKTARDRIQPSCYITQDVLDGYNGAVFTYGQPTSGATQTMARTFAYSGIIHELAQELFNYLFSMDENLEFTIKVSYYEMCNEKIRDLLDVTKADLSIRSDRNGVPNVQGVTERYVSSPEEIMDWVEEGMKNRRIGVTNMTEHLSRSHSILLIDVAQTNRVTHQLLNGKLYFVDLTGMEMVPEAGAEFEEPELD